MLKKGWLDTCSVVSYFLGSSQTLPFHGCINKPFSTFEVKARKLKPARYGLNVFSVLITAAHARPRKRSTIDRTSRSEAQTSLKATALLRYRAAQPIFREIFALSKPRFVTLLIILLMLQSFTVAASVHPVDHSTDAEISSIAQGIDELPENETASDDHHCSEHCQHCCHHGCLHAVVAAQSNDVFHSPMLHVPLYSLLSTSAPFALLFRPPKIWRVAITSVLARD